jgi:hypothetical protein
VGRWAGTAIALWALHGVGLARSCLAVREDADVVPVHDGGAERTDSVEDVGLAHLRREDLFEFKLLWYELVFRILDQQVVVVALYSNTCSIV